jgi:hypothetical protein
MMGRQPRCCVGKWRAICQVSEPTAGARSVLVEGWCRKPTAGVRLACHPHDPAYPVGGLNGIEHVMGSADGIRRFLALSSSRNHGLNFCQGTVAEMFKTPGEAMIPVIEEFASTGRIFRVRRNIRSGYLVSEVFPTRATSTCSSDQGLPARHDGPLCQSRSCFRSRQSRDVSYRSRSATPWLLQAPCVPHAPLRFRLTSQRRHVWHSLSRRARPAGSAHLAQDNWPTKPVKVIVPFPAGGTSDIMARMVSAPLQKELGQPFIVENIGGAGGTIGVARALTLPADGYTIVLTGVGSNAVAHGLEPKPTYDSMRDFMHISQIHSGPNVLVAHPEAPFKTFKEFIDYVHRPEQLNYGYAGASVTWRWNCCARPRSSTWSTCRTKAAAR